MDFLCSLSKEKKDLKYRANIYLFKVNNGNTWTICEIYSKLTIKTLESFQWRRLILTRFYTSFCLFHRLYCLLWTSKFYIRSSYLNLLALKKWMPAGQLFLAFARVILLTFLETYLLLIVRIKQHWRLMEMIKIL